MRELDKALADIIAIRSQIAAGTAFRGYGPTALAATGGLALLTAGAQSLWLDDPNAQPVTFLMAWAVTAVLAAAIVEPERRVAARRRRRGRRRRPGSRRGPAARDGPRRRDRRSPRRLGRRNGSHR